MSSIFRKSMGLLKAGTLQYRSSIAAIPASTSKAYRLRPYSQTAVISSSINPLSAAFWNVMKRYEDLIGLTDVKEAQQRVIKAEEDFMQYQTKRREQQETIQSIQSRLREVRYDLDKTPRTDDRYLELITTEHKLIKQEKLLSEDFKIIERIERDNFGRLSTSLRESHEKERERAEKTKYWSIIGSVVGALIGILGTTVNNRMRFRELKNIVQESADPARIQRVLGDLL